MKRHWIIMSSMLNIFRTGLNLSGPWETFI